MKDDLKAQLDIIKEIDDTNVKKDKAKVDQLKQENDRLMRKYHDKFRIEIIGESKLGKPNKHFADDIQQFKKKFMESQKLIKRKLDYFYAPYEKNRNNQAGGERLYNRYMSQKYKRGELSVVTPSGKIKNESKTERMKRYGKSTVVHKTAKFEDSMLHASVNSNHEKSKSK